MLHLLETKDTPYNPQWREGRGRGGENNFNSGAVLIYGSTVWAVLDLGLFVLFSGACPAVLLSVLSYTGSLFGPTLCLHCAVPFSVQRGLLRVAQICVRGPESVPFNLICLNIKAKENH